MGAFEVEFSGHAKRQLKERNIRPELVRETLESPEQIVMAGKNRKVAQRTYQRRGKDFLLRVVYTEQVKAEIITMYWTSKVSKYRRKS